MTPHVFEPFVERARVKVCRVNPRNGPEDRNQREKTFGWEFAPPANCSSRGGGELVRACGKRLALDGKSELLPRFEATRKRANASDALAAK